MSLSAPAPRVNRPVVISAAVVVALAFALTGPTRGSAAVLGAALAVGNWFALRFLAARFVQAGGASSAGFSLLLIAKIGLLMAIVYVLIARLGTDPIGLAIGLSVLFIGPLLAGLTGVSAGAATGQRGGRSPHLDARAQQESVRARDPAAINAAREER